MNFAKKAAIAFTAIATSAVLSASPIIAAEELPRTQTVWTESGDKGVNVYPYIPGEKRVMWFDFESEDFANIQSIYFNINYNTDEAGTKRGIEGTFNPANIKDIRYYKDKPYIRKEFTIGTCSQNICKYDSNPRDFKLTVKTKMLKGAVAEYTQVLTINTRP